METRHDSLAEEWLTTRQAADVLGVPIDTVRRWADDGSLAHWRPAGKGRHRRFRRADVEAFRAAAERKAS